MQLANPGCYVEQKAEPAHPVEKLYFADFATLRGESSDRVEHLAEKAEDPRFGLRRRSFKMRIAFTDVEGADDDCAAKGDTGDYTENLELCIAQPGEDVREVHIAGEVT